MFSRYCLKKIHPCITRLKKGLQLAFIGFLIFNSNSSAQTAANFSELYSIDKAVLKFMKLWDLPGASLAIAKDGKLIYVKGFGYADVKTKEPVQPSHRFRIASMSKPLTATAIFKLIEEGKLSLQDKVFGTDGILNDTAYLKIADARSLTITVEQLLSHSAGWIRRGDACDPMLNSNMVCNYFQAKTPATQQQVIQYMLEQQLDYTPGSRQEYLNFGYCVLGRVIEKVSGLTYEEYVKKNILKKIGADSYDIAGNFKDDKKKNEVTYYDRPKAALVAGYIGKEVVEAPYGEFNVTAMDAHGGWIASATDILKFALAVDGRSSQPDILSTSSIKSMITSPFPSAYFAHGWNVNASGMRHAGLLPGSSGLLNVENNGLAIALVFNSYSFSEMYFRSMSEIILKSIYTISSFPKHNLFEQLGKPSGQDIP